MVTLISLLREDAMMIAFQFRHRYQDHTQEIILPTSNPSQNTILPGGCIRPNFPQPNHWPNWPNQPNHWPNWPISPPKPKRHPIGPIWMDGGEIGGGLFPPVPK